MLQKITSFEQVKDLSEIVLGKDETNREIYKIIQADQFYIRLFRRRQFSSIRLLPFKNIIEGEWYFDPEKGIADVKSNTDSQLIRSKTTNPENRPKE